MPSPKAALVGLSAQERQVLEGWVRRRKTSQALAARSQIVLQCAAGGTIGEVAAELGVSRDMVSKWRGRFLRERLEGLTDEPRPFIWTKTADEILATLAAYGQRINDSGH